MISGVVLVSIVLQGLTMSWLLRKLGIAGVGRASDDAGTLTMWGAWTCARRGARIRAARPALVPAPGGLLRGPGHARVLWG